MSERVLVTGGAGFIGSHLCEEWLRRGAAVVALDDLSRGRAENLRGMLGQRGFEFVRGSASDAALVEQVASGVTRVFHLAASVGVRGVCERPHDVIAADLAATRVVGDVALRLSLPLCFTSSSEVYGPLAEPPLAEDHGVVFANDSPRAAYAASKLAGEALLVAAHRQHEHAIVIARLFNVVGPRQRGGHVLPEFVRAVLERRALVVHGSGAQTRCFAHVRDVVRALADLATEPRAIGRVVNVGSARELSILELAGRVSACAGAAERLEFRSHAQVYSARFTETRRRVPDLARLEQLIGWVPAGFSDEWVTELLDEHSVHRGS
ncbi:MAG: NAD-dependent epimerase/dehydratase family protein [Planctomycetota bacterium]|nr:MAG: NAD-dependent epimerase/dehydratase family protein [Planctomycetota bacterium]